MEKEKLKEYVYARKNLVFLQKKLVELREESLNLKSPIITDMPKLGLVENQVERQVIEIDELEIAITKSYQKALKKLKDIEEIINSKELTELEKYILRLRYINNIQWEDIKIGYTKRQLLRIHAEALKKI